MMMIVQADAFDVDETTACAEQASVGRKLYVELEREQNVHER